MELSHLRQVEIAASDADNGDWLVVCDAAEHDWLLPGDV